MIKMEEQIIQITTEYVTLGQLLKLADIIQSGGMAKWYLGEHYVFVNEEEEQRRGRKLRDGDVIEFPNEDLKVTIKNRN